MKMKKFLEKHKELIDSYFYSVFGEKNPTNAERIKFISWLPRLTSLALKEVDGYTKIREIK